MDIPPLLPKAQPTDWCSRNWKWLVPLLCAIVLLFIGCFVVVISGFMKSSDAYVGAVMRVHASQAVAKAIGTPMQEGLFVTGHINVSGGSGEAELAIPVEGPRGKATIYVEAKKSLGEWHFEHLIVDLVATHERIDVLKSQMPEKAREGVPSVKEEEASRDR